MKRFADHPDAIALGISLVLHGGIVAVCAALTDPTPRQRRITIPQAVPARALVEDASRQAPVLPMPPAVAELPKPPAPTIVPLLEPERPALQEIKPTAVIPPELAPQDPPSMRAMGFGELTGDLESTAKHSLSGDRPMEAPKAEQDQPYISRDPSGVKRPADKPAKQDFAEEEHTGVVAEAGSEAKPLVQQQIAPIPAPEPKPVAANDGPGLKAEPTPKPPQFAMVTPQQPSPAVPELPGQTQSKPGKRDAAASPASSADDAPLTDSESDAFSTKGAAIFRPGRVMAHFGRKVTTVRPRLSMAAQYDLFTLPSPDVVLKVTADETGKVSDVSITKSSGSKEADQACKLAMYEWWFEPPRDKSGKPQVSQMLWTIAFRTY